MTAARLRMYSSALLISPFPLSGTSRFTTCGRWGRHTADRARGRFHQAQRVQSSRLRRQLGLTILQPERLRDECLPSVLRGLTPTSCVVTAYGRILTDAVLAIPRLASSTFMRTPAEIPRRRAVHRAVMAGDAETGVTIMHVVKALDAGPMMMRYSAQFTPKKTSSEASTPSRVWRRCARRHR